MSGSFQRVLGNPRLRRVQLAFFGSTLGDWAYGIAITVWAFSVGGAAAVGAFQAVRFVAVALAGPVGAAIADRTDRRRFMMGSDGVRAVLVAAVALTIGLDGPDAPVYVLAVAAAMAGASFRSAQAGLVPRLVDSPAELTAANAVASNLETVAMFSGPAIGGLLVALVDVDLVIWLNVASFVWSFALVASVRVAAAPGEAAQKGPRARFGSEVTAGFVALRRDRDLGVVAALAAAQGLLWGALTVFVVMISVDLLGVGAAGVGYLNSVMGVGTVVGGLVVLTRVERSRLANGMALGVLGWSLPLLAMALFPSPVTAVAALAVIGLSDPWVNLGLDTIPQRVAPEGAVSRVFSAVESALIGSMALGAAVAPVLVHLLGLRTSMTLLGVVVTFGVLAALPRMRRLDARLAEPEHLMLLQSLDLFAPLAAPVQETLARSLEPRAYAAGATILSEGEDADRFYVIASGSVEVTRGGRPLRIEEPGEYFGEIGLLRDVPRTATVRAVTDVEVLGLGRADFLGAVAGVQDASRAAEEVVAHRLAV